MHFGTKSYLKSTRNHTAKHALSDGVSQPINYAILGIIIFLLIY